MQEIKLRAEIRNQRGTRKELSAIRKDRKIPAVIYGGEKPPLSVLVVETELLKATRTGGTNAILHLEHPEGKDTVILKSLQRHAVTQQPVHADFQRISLREKIEVRVPLHVVGEAPGVKLQGGVLEHALRELRVRALPTAIPQHIEIDVSRLEINHNILVKDVTIPAGVEVLDSPEHIVVNILQPRVEEVAPAEAAVAEPEVIAKGKKEEEGAEGAAEPEAKAKGGAPAAAPAPAQKKEGK
ncbi:MAG: 50S ribosomal protein L25 [Elusimicrobia bacterium]|nr:50S ribosomal protein L25 [Elusimicrobiota bacterium]